MPDFVKIYKYYKTLSELNQLVFIDMIKNLIAGIKQIEKMKIEFSKIEYNFILEDMKDYFKEIGISETSGFTLYKKVDYTADKAIAELININKSKSISKMALIRRGTVLKLIQYDFIEDINVGIDSFFSEEDMVKEGFVIVNEQGVKKLDFKKLQLANKEANLFGKNFKLTKDNLSLFLYLQFIEELRKYYGEDQLNEELNMDDSYRQIIFYKADISILEELSSKLFKDGDKDIIEKYEFRDNKLFVNGKEFKIKDSQKTPLFVELISQYLESTNKKKINITDLITFFEENNKKDFHILKLSLNNIKNTFIKTISKQLGNKYINNKILKIKGSDIVLV